jgi:hypothetical protein
MEVCGAHDTELGAETLPASERPIEISFLADVPSGSQPHDVFGDDRGLWGGCLILDNPHS